MGLTKSQLQQVRQLRQKKHRQRYGIFVAEGPKVVDEFVDSAYVIQRIYSLDEYVQHYDAQGLEVVAINSKEMSQLTALRSPQGVLALIEIPGQSNPVDYTQGLHVLLDDIQDPGNLGTIIRAAEWFGVQSILCSSGCADVYNEKVVQASMGAISQLQVRYGDLSDCLKEHPQVDSYAAMLDGHDLFDTALAQNALLVMGNEGHGVSKAVLSKVQQHLTIPKYGKAESLNVAMATTICLSYFRSSH